MSSRSSLARKVMLVLATSLIVYQSYPFNNDEPSRTSYDETHSFVSQLQAKNGCKLDLENLVISPIWDYESEEIAYESLTSVVPLLEYVMTLPNKHKLVALFDTGAQVSCINKDLAKSLAKEFPGLCKIGRAHV